MKPPHDHQRSPDPPDRGVTPLTLSKVDGTRHVRFADVEAEIAKALADGPSAWNIKKLKSETLVHLIRAHRWRSDMADIHGRLFDEIGRRVAVIVRDWAKGFNAAETDDIQSLIAHSVLEHILALTPTRKSEYLEIDFRTKVKQFTLTEVGRRTNCPVQLFPLREGDSGDGGQAYGSEVEDDGLSPEDLASLTEDRERVRAALSAIKDERHREALILHVCEGWPITKGDPSVPTVFNHFRGSVTRDQIYKWIQGAKATVRKAMGEHS